MDPATASADSKKCPHCGSWSGHQRQPDDQCEHCHELLDPSGPGKAAEMKQAWNWEMPTIMLITIDPAEPWPVRLVKYVVRGGQLLFMATISFIVWFLTTMAG